MARVPKTKNPTPPTSPVAVSAILVDLDISVWSGRKFDRDVTRSVTESLNTERTAGRWNKHLFGGPVPELTALNRAVSQLYREHIAQTFPWNDGPGRSGGRRLLPSGNYFEYADRMRKQINNVNRLVDRLAAVLPRLIEESRPRLGPTFDINDYPTAEELRARYRVRVYRFPLPMGTDFRCDLPDTEIAALAKETNAVITDAIGSAMKEAWTRLGDVITQVRASADKQTLRDRTIERLGELAATLGRMNITNDPALEEVRKLVTRDITTIDPKAVRSDEKVATSAVAAVDAILAKMAGFYTPAKSTTANEEAA